MEQFKNRWGIRSNFQAAIILLVFAINGSLSVAISEPVLSITGISETTHHTIVYWAVKIALTLIAYQVSLLMIGTIFGQGEFFWNFTKKMFGFNKSQKVKG